MHICVVIWYMCGTGLSGRSDLLPVVLVASVTSLIVNAGHEEGVIPRAAPRRSTLRRDRADRASQL